MNDTIRIQLTVNEVSHSLEAPEPTGPYGAIGIGEPPTVASAPATANAIYDAVGVRIRSLPITAGKIKSALENLADD